MKQMLLIPKSLEIFNFLAKYPSKKSKNESKIIYKHPKFINPFEKKTIAISPHNKFKIVKKLAIFNIFEFIYTILKHYFI